MNLRHAIALASTGLLMLSTTTQAAQQTWLVTGEVSSISDNTSVGGPFAVGDPFTHLFMIDDSVLPFSAAGNFSEFEAIVFSRFEIPSRSFSIDWNDGNRVTTNNQTGQEDEWAFIGDAEHVTASPPTLGGGVDFSSLLFTLRPPVDTFLVDPPPLVQPDPTWPVGFYTFSYRILSPRQTYRVDLQIETFQAVPEPGTGAITIFGVAGVMCARRAGKSIRRGRRRPDCTGAASGQFGER